MRIENSFILAPGIGEKTEQKLWKNGVKHWDEVQNTNAISENKKSKLESFLTKARKNLDVGNSVFFGDKLPNKEVWRTYRNFQESACFFDIETTGLDKQRKKVTTVSVYRNGESKTLVRGKDLTAENLRKEFHEASVIVSFNGKMFDRPFLEHNFEVQIDNPHIDLMHTCKRINLSGGLKKIEKELGIDRELEDVDGREAVRLWKKYEKRGNEEALNKLVRYNQYDAENLQQLLEKAHKQLTERFYRKHLP